MTDTEEPGERHQSRAVPTLMTATWEAATTDPDPLAALGREKGGSAS